MDSQPPPSSPQTPPPPDINRNPTPQKSALGGAGTLPGNRPSTPVSVRHFPRPPALLPRLLLLCFRPESWPEMARFPSRFTFVPLLLAILIAAIAAGLGDGTRALANLEKFAATYDARYPALTLSSDGTLSSLAPLAAPIRFQNGVNGELVLIDPTGNTTPASIKTPNTLLITDKELWIFIVPGFEPSHTPLSGFSSGIFGGWIPEPGATNTIDGAFLKARIQQSSTLFLAYMTIMLGGALFMMNALWAALMIFLLAPLVMVAAAGPRQAAAVAGTPDRRLLLPRRAAQRIAAAVLIPLILLGGVLHAVGRSVNALLGSDAGSLFWFFSAGALSLWAGVMARKLYTPKKAAR